MGVMLDTFTTNPKSARSYISKLLFLNVIRFEEPTIQTKLTFMKTSVLSLFLILSFCFGFAQTPAPTPSSFYVNDNSTLGDKYCAGTGSDGNLGTSASPYATVSKALSVAAKGDFIYVDAGTYAEKVFLGKSISLVGAGADLVRFIWPTTVSPSFSDNNNIPYYMQFDSWNGGGTNPANIVNISGISIDGENRVFNEKAFVHGLRFDNAAGTIKDCVFKNFQNPGSTDPTFKTDRAVFFQAAANTPAQVNFINNTIVDFYNLGLVGAGPGLSLYASGNTITGNGVATIRQYGVSAEYTKSAQIEGNTISNLSNYFSQINPNDMSYAVSVSGNSTPSVIKNNVVSNSPGGLLSTNTNITIEGNELTTPHTYGIALQGVNGAYFTASVSSNTIIGSKFGVIAGSFDGAKSTVDIQQNSITGSVVNSIYNFGNNNIVAKCNWLGSSDPGEMNASTFGGVKIFSLLTSGTDASPETRGFQTGTTSCIATPVSFYVNDNSQSGDILTTAVGNDNNPGTKEAPFATVGRALYEAQSGDFVHVDAGTYAEKVFFTKSSNIVGAGADLVKFVWPENITPNYYGAQNIPWYNQFDSYNGGGDNTPSLTINLSGITIDGGNRIFNEKAIVNGVKFHNTGGTIENCIFKNFQNPGVADPTYKTDRAVYFLADASLVNGTSFAEVNFRNNKIENFYNFGLFGQGGSLILNAVNNEIIGNGISTIRQRGININFAKSINIDGNKISNISKYDVGGDRSFAVSAVGIATSSVIKNNLVLNSYAGFLLTNSNLSIVENEITATQLFGFVLMGSIGTSNMTLFSNKITGSEVGISTYIFNQGKLNIDLQQNSISNASVNSIINNGGVDITATCNWFGSADSRSVYSSINGNVTINSFLTNGEDALPNTIGFQKGEVACTALEVSSYYVNDQNTEGDELTGTIGDDNNPGTKELPLASVKRALQLAMPGSTIYVDAGTYYEQVKIRRPVTIIGAGREKTNFFLPESIELIYKTGDGVSNYAIIHAQDVNGAIIQNIAVEGDNLNFNNGRLYGIVLERSSGVVNGCEVRNFKNKNTDNLAYSTGSGIMGINFSSAVKNIEVYDNIVKDFYYSGIIMYGPNVTYQVHDNTIIGNGLGEFYQNGIEIYAGNGTVKNNAVSNIAEYTAQDFVEGAGIIVAGTYESTTEISGNTTTNVEAGIMLGNGTQVVKNNKISGSIVYGIEGFNYGGKNAIFTIENNFIENNPISLWFGQSGVGTLTVEVHNNSITGIGSKSIVNENATVNASCNWFGSNNQKKIDPYLSGTVNITPWLIDGEDNDLEMAGFQPKPETCKGNPLKISLLSKTDILKCAEDQTGSIDVTIEGGAGTLEIQWTKEEDPDFIATTDDLKTVGQGNYHLSVTDANGETLSLQVELEGPEALNVDVIVEPIYCNGETSPQVQVTAWGGKPISENNPYAISWFDASTADIRTDLTSGIYTVSVTDANGCTVTDENVLLEDPLPISPSISATDVLCNGGATGTAIVSATGGTLGVLDDFSTYTFRWINGATTADISGLVAGTYSVIVEDDYGCTATGSVTIGQPSTLRASTQVTNVLCAGQSNGSLTINANGGTPLYRYAIDNGVLGTTSSFGSLSSGNHSFRVLDANDCELVVNFIVTMPAPIQISQPVVVQTCSGGATGSITLSASGGTPQLKYNWTGPNGFTATKLSITALAAGTYSLTVTDANGCTNTLDVVVTTAPAISISGTVVNVSCFGTSTGSITLTPSGTTGVITYAWSGPNAYKSTNKDIFALKAGSYTVTVKSGTCTYTQSFNVTQPVAALAMTLSKVDITSCGGSGTINVATTTGGTAPYQYSLNNGPLQSSGTFTVTAAATYAVKVQDANGCLLSGSIAVGDTGNDPYESNNKQTAAVAYAMNSGNINARIAPAATDLDWYKFTVRAASLTHTVTLLNPGTIRYAIDLYDSRARLVAPTSSTIGPTSRKTYTNLVAGAVYSLRIQGPLSFVCYQLSITDGGALLPAVNPMLNTIATASIDAKKTTSIVNQLDASVVPNPHPGQFNLTVNSPAKGIGNITLMTASGQIISQRKLQLNKGNNTIRYENINPGMLIYRVTLNDMQATGRIIGVK